MDIGTLALALGVLAYIAAWKPLEKMELDLFPGLTAHYRRDLFVQIPLAILFVAPFGNYPPFIAILSLVALFFLVQRTLAYFDPFFSAHLTSKTPLIAAETAERAFRRHNTALGLALLKNIHQKAATLSPATLPSLFQQLENVYQASKEGAALSTLGKLALVLDPNSSGMALYSIGKSALKAQKVGSSDVGTQATVILAEVAKGRPPQEIVPALSQMTEIAKESLRQNQDLPIPFLLKPFRDLKEHFQNVSGSEGAVQALSQVIAEFEELEVVLRTLPSLTSPSSEEK